jgi:adenylate cyclase
LRYRSKIYLSFLTVSTLSVMGGISFVYNKLADALKFELRTKVVSVAATAAALIDPDEVRQLSQSLDPKSTPFFKIQHDLLEVRDNNRRPDLFVKYIYLLKPETSESQEMIFLVEAQNAVMPGEKDEQQNQSKIRSHLDDFYSPNRFIHDKFGVWMSGFAPIVDNQGNYVATLGVDISAKEVDNVLNSALRYTIFGLIFSLSLALSLAYYLAHKMTDALTEINHCLDDVSKGQLNTSLNIETNDEFGKLSETINKMIKGLKERQALKTSFSKYVSTYVMDQILSDQSNVNLQGERKKITVLFSDIRHFTAISESMTPEDVVHLLNEYFEVMLKVVFKHQGTIDKFMGDGLMAEFGAPLEDSEQEVHAVRCAIDMIQELKKLNVKLESDGKPKLSIGIGIHSGFAIMGNIGSEKRMEYTAIGDCVNVASRLEQATKTYKHPILVSEETYLALNNQFECNSIGTISLPGRTQEIKVYAVEV